MSRRRVIRPQLVEHWPSFFWSRAESSYAGNDLECRGGCRGTGLETSRQVCGRCRGSGLLVPRRTPARPRNLTPHEPAWAGVSSEQLVWPLPLLWQVPLTLVPGARDVYHSDDSTLAFMNCGRLCLTLFRLDGDAERQLERAYRMVAGPNFEALRFVLPKSG